MDKIVSCMVCGERFASVQLSLAHRHFTEGFTVQPNDLDAWYRTAKDLDLTVVTSPDGTELVIFNREHTERGYAWIKLYRLAKAYRFDSDICDTDPAGMYAHLGRMARKIVEPTQCPEC